MKKFLAMVLVLILTMGIGSALACECNCYFCQMCTTGNEAWARTTMVVADEDYKYNIRASIRATPDIDGKYVATARGGDIFDFYGFYPADDGRIWGQTYYNGKVVYISMRYLQPEENIGSFFWLPETVYVRENPTDASKIIATFIEDQLIQVVEIVREGNEHIYWGKVLCDGRYGYIPMISLDAIW